MDTRALSFLLFTFSKIRHYSPKLFSVAAQVLSHKLRQTNKEAENALQLINNVSRPRSASREDVRVGRRMREGDVLFTPQFTPIDLTHISLSFARFAHYDRPLFDQIALATKSLLLATKELRLQFPYRSRAGRGKLEVWHISNLLWSFGVLQHFDEGLFTLAFKVLDNTLNPAPPPTLTNSPIPAPKPTPRLKSDRPDLYHHLPIEAAMQLFQAYLLQGDIYDGVLESPLVTLAPGVLNRCEGIWRTSQREAVSSSPFQRQVFEELDRMGLDPRNEARTSDGLFSIDIGIRWKGRRVAVEVDGGWHFTRSDSPRRALGQAVAKWRCLEMRGWRVVSIPWFEWFQINRGYDDHEGGSDSNGDKDSRMRQEYLKHALDGTLWRRHQTSANNNKV